MKSTSRRERGSFKTIKAYIDAQPRGMRQVDIANDLGIAHGLLSELKGGKRPVGGGLARRLSRLTGVPLESLLAAEPKFKIQPSNRAASKRIRRG